MMILPSPLTRTAATVAAKSYIEALNVLLAPGAQVPVTTRRLLSRNCFLVLRHGGQDRSKWLVVRRTSTEQVALDAWARRLKRVRWGGVAIVFVADHASAVPLFLVHEFWCQPNRGKKYG
jgi:hypothetical protein